MVSLQWDKEFALEQTADDQELLDELLVLFKDSAAADYKNLQAAAAAKNMEGVLAAAHSIKGAAASLGIEGVRISAMEIEECARESQTRESIEEKIVDLGELLSQFNQLL